MDKILESMLAHGEAMDDQEWAAGVDWFDDSEIGETMELREMFIDDDPERLIERMTIDPRWADVVQRLGLLAFDEILRRSIRRRAESA